MSVFHMVIPRVLSVLKYLHSSWDAGGSLILTSRFCLAWCQGKGLSAVRDRFITFPPLQEGESLLSCSVTPALFSAVAKHLCHSLEVGCSDASALSLPVYFNGICAIAKVKGVILTYFFLVS